MKRACAKVGLLPVGDDPPLASARGRAVRACVLRPTLARRHHDNSNIASSRPPRFPAWAASANGSCARTPKPPTLEPSPSPCEGVQSAGRRAAVAPVGAGPIRVSATPWVDAGLDAAVLVGRRWLPRAWAGEHR